MKVWMAIVASVLFLFSCAWMYMMVELHERDRSTTTVHPDVMVRGSIYFPCVLTPSSREMIRKPKTKLNLGALC